MNFNFTLIAQAIMFVLFILFCYKLVWPHLMRMIEKRQKEIADGLAAAERGKRDLAQAESKVAQTLDEAKQRATEIIAQSERRAAQLIEEAKNTAKNEGDRERASAKAEIQQAVSRAKESLRDQVAALAVAGAEKILQREVNAQSHADLLTQLRRDL